MGLESATYIDGLDVNNPDGADQQSQGDNHLRMLKLVLKNTFPGLAGRVFRIQAKSGNYTAVANDNTSLIAFSVVSTLSLAAAATLGNGFLLMVYAAGPGVVTINPDGTELVNGAVQYDVPAGQMAIVVCDGAGFFAFLIPSNSAAWSTGDAKLTYKNVADAGWVMANDGSIGSAASSATTRANADTQALYTLLWNNVANTWAPVSGGRGANATVDFAANKTLTLPKALGRALAISGAGAGLTSRGLGETLGAETHTLSQAETPLKSHSHGVNDSGHVHGRGESTDQNLIGGASGAFVRLNVAPPSTTDSATTGISIQAASDAAATAHNNMPPESFLNAMIKL